MSVEPKLKSKFSIVNSFRNDDHLMTNHSPCQDYTPKTDGDSNSNKPCPGTFVSCCYTSFGCTYKSTGREIAGHEWQCPYRQKSPESSLTSITLSSTSSVFQTDAPSASVNGSQDFFGTSNGGSFPKYQDNLYQNNSFYTPLNHLDNIECNLEDFTVTIVNPERLEFGISFVGGFDTPLQCIVIQEIFRDGRIAMDGRLRPGDQITKINEYYLSQASHIECRDILNRVSQSGDTIYLTIHRDIVDKRWIPMAKEEILTFVLEKPTDRKMGLKLAGKTNKSGLYIQEVLPDSQASLDGRLKKDDRILKINEQDLVFGTHNEALEIIKSVKDSVKFVISRIIRPQTPDIIRAAGPDSDSSMTPIATSSSYPGLKNVTTLSFGSTNSPFPVDSHIPVKSSYREEVVEVDKKPGESLGMSVAGGVNSQRGDTPVYITNITANSLLKNTNRIDKGDILLAVNETELLGLSHERAVEALKQARDNCNKVTVRVLKVPNLSMVSNNDNFIPSWMYWLKLPGYCQIPRLITLSRDVATGSLGFSIVGGNDLINLYNQNSSDLSLHKEVLYRPIMIKSIVSGSSAHKNGRLKCGDILISINEYSLTNVSHSDAVNLFKSMQGPVQLKVVSWPGTII